MIKDKADQIIICQLYDADGSTYTGANPTITVQKDGGTKSPASGESTDNGDGQWKYVPTQAETNGDHVSFTWTMEDGRPIIIQLYTELEVPDVRLADAVTHGGTSAEIDLKGINVIATNSGCCLLKILSITLGMNLNRLR